MAGSDLVPYGQQPQPKQSQTIRYTVDFGRGPVNVVIGELGVYITPLNSSIELSQIGTIAANILFMVNQLPQSTYQAFAEGINRLLYFLSAEVSDLSSLEEEVTALYRGAVGQDDVSNISGASIGELTTALQGLYERVNRDNMQLRLPLKFDESAELKSQP